MKITKVLSVLILTFLISCQSDSTTSKNDELGKRFFENYSS